MSTASLSDRVESVIDQGFKYTQADHEQYKSLGYVTFKQFLHCSGLESCRKHVDRMLAQLQPGRDPSETYFPLAEETWIWSLATESRVLDMVERQVGENIVLWSVHLLCKAPHSGMEVPWHQDAPYLSVAGALSGAVWIPLDDIDEDNGGLFILPGWHKRGKLPITGTDQELFDQQIDPAVMPEDLAEGRVQYRMRAGQMAVHDKMLPHASPPNCSDRWRRVVILNYMAADGTMGRKNYINYRDGLPLPREYFLVRGQDVAQRGFRHHPTDQSSAGFHGR